MVNLPTEFESYTRALFGEERYARFRASFEEAPPVSIRINPFKVFSPFEGDTEDSNTNSPLSPLRGGAGGGVIPWCRNAHWLASRPDFTLDPLLHAGCYYVQESGSMFLDQVLRQYVSKPVTMLDLCAAPGGKSTLARAALPSGSLLYANEPDHRRAHILMENLQKQGHPQVIVTNNYAKDYARAGLQFDVILTDVPCSGEGMFRKDEGAIREWSLQNVMRCTSLQRSIIEDIWPCLRPGGLLIYSTCTFNTHENEENVQWMAETLGAEILPVETQADWNISGSLLDGFDQPVYRFIPGTTKSEGLFMAVLRKDESSTSPLPHRGGRKNDTIKGLRVLSDGNYPQTIKGKDKVPQHAEALLCNLEAEKYPRVEVTREQALQYLRREAIALQPEAPRGYVIITYCGHALGFVKNLGNRANNLYPQEWRIRK